MNDSFPLLKTQAKFFYTELPRTRLLLLLLADVLLLPKYMFLQHSQLQQTYTACRITLHFFTQRPYGLLQQKLLSTSQGIHVLPPSVLPSAFAAN
jgi:hypothetical protein